MTRPPPLSELESCLVPGLVSVWQGVHEDLLAIRSATRHLEELLEKPPLEAAAALAREATSIRRMRKRAERMVESYGELRRLLGASRLEMNTSQIPDIDALIIVPGVARQYEETVKSVMTHAGFSDDPLP